MGWVYYNCHRKGSDYNWHKDNLPAGFGINDFNTRWVFDYKWNPVNEGVNWTQWVHHSNRHLQRQIKH